MRWNQSANIRDIDAKIDKPLSIEQLSRDADLDHLSGSLQSWQECPQSDAIFAVHRAVGSKILPAKSTSRQIASTSGQIQLNLTSIAVTLNYLELCFNVKNLQSVLSNISWLKRYMYFLA